MVNRHNVRSPQHTQKCSEFQNRTHALLELCIVVSVDANWLFNVIIATVQITQNVRGHGVRDGYDTPPNVIGPANTTTFLEQATSMSRIDDQDGKNR